MTQTDPRRDELRSLLHAELDRSRRRRTAVRVGVLSIVLVVCSIPILMGPLTPGRSVTPEQLAAENAERDLAQVPQPRSVAPSRRSLTAITIEPIPNVFDRVRRLEPKPGLKDSLALASRARSETRLRQLSDVGLMDALAAAGQPSGYLRTKTGFHLIALSE